MPHVYLQLRHAADELVGHLHIRTAGIVEGDKLGSQVLVAIEEPGVGREIPGRAGRWDGEDLSPFSHSCSCSYTQKDRGSPRVISSGLSPQAYRAKHRHVYPLGTGPKW